MEVSKEKEAFYRVREQIYSTLAEIRLQNPGLANHLNHYLKFDEEKCTAVYEGDEGAALISRILSNGR